MQKRRRYEKFDIVRAANETVLILYRVRNEKASRRVNLEEGLKLCYVLKGLVSSNANRELRRSLLKIKVKLKDIDGVIKILKRISGGGGASSDRELSKTQELLIKATDPFWQEQVGEFRDRQNRRI